MCDARHLDARIAPPLLRQRNGNLKRYSGRQGHVDSQSPHHRKHPGVPDGVFADDNQPVAHQRAACFIDFQHRRPITKRTQGREKMIDLLWRTVLFFTLTFASAAIMALPYIA
jgi:hypothetical protein